MEGGDLGGQVVHGGLQLDLLFQVLITLLERLGDLCLQVGQAGGLRGVRDAHTVLLLSAQVLESLLEAFDLVLHLLPALLQTVLVSEGILQLRLHHELLLVELVVQLSPEEAILLLQLTDGLQEVSRIDRGVLGNTE